jgi:hypothetical protein
MSTIHKQLEGSLMLEERKAEITPANVTPMGILQLAVSQGADIDNLTRLLELQERWEANEARKAFNAAMARFKQNPPQIIKNKQVQFKDTKYKHATLDNASDLITKALSAVGISHTWALEQDGNTISVTCILTHELGHSERTTLRSGADTTGSKNAIQAVASAVTYLERYTLFAATGLAAAEDDDGNGAGGTPQMPFEDVAYHKDQIESATTMAGLQKVFAAGYKQAKSTGDIPAMKTLTDLYERMKREVAQ